MLEIQDRWQGENFEAYSGLNSWSFAHHLDK